MGIRDRLAAYQFDAAVVLFGTVLENASQELEKRGPEDKPRWEPKYTMKQLLDQSFRLPLGDEEQVFDPQGIDGVNYDEVG